MIGLCIPTIGAGIKYLDYYIRNLMSLASHPEKIRIYVTYHTKMDRHIIEDSSVDVHIHKKIYVEESGSGMFRASTNHSSAINAMAATVEEDVVVFSDYDMAFIKRGWDDVITNALNKFHIFGASYTPITFNGEMGISVINEAMPWMKYAKLMKYQKLPNLTFMAIRKEALDRICDGSDLTNFGKFLSAGGMPFRLINSLVLAQENNIPIGTIQWMDTGMELPGLIVEHRLNYQVLGIRGLDTQDVLKKDVFDKNDILRQPEFFYLDEDPFLFHFKKGSAKATTADSAKYNDQFTEFTKGIDEYIRKTDKMAPRLPVHS